MNFNGDWHNTSLSLTKNTDGIRGSPLTARFFLSLLLTLCLTSMAFGANPDAMNMKKLVQIAQNFINVSKVIMALFAAIYGTWRFVIMKMGNEGVKKSMIEFLSSSFFAFGGTLIVDALLAMTVGKLVFKGS